MAGSSPFAIAAASRDVTLDHNGRGQAAFTVANASGRPQRVRVEAVAAVPEQSTWYSVEAPERDLEVHGADSFVAVVAVPPGTDPGSYSFHLRVTSVHNPDEVWADGPETIFDVPAADVPQPAPGIPGWAYAVVGAVALLVAVVVVFLLTRDGDGPDVAAVSITPPAPEVAEGGSVQLTATLLDPDGNELTGQAVTWSSDDPDIAPVNDEGIVMGATAGEATITALSGGTRGSADVVVLDATPTPDPTEPPPPDPTEPPPTRGASIP